jgi:hypothetical protein
MRIKDHGNVIGRSAGRWKTFSIEADDCGNVLEELPNVLEELPNNARPSQLGGYAKGQA